MTEDEYKERIAQLEQAVEHALQCLGDAGSNKEHDPSWIRPKGLTREQVNERCIQAYHALHQALTPAQKEGEMDDLQRIAKWMTEDEPIPPAQKEGES